MIYDLRQSYNRQYYWRIFKLKVRTRKDLFKIFLIKQLLHLCYIVDNDLATKMLKMKWSDK